MTPIASTEVAKSLIDTKLFTLLYKELAQPGVRQAGKALATVLGLGNTILLPFKMANEKANALYTSHMEQYREKLKEIPEEKIIEVAPEIGVPILENLEKTKSSKVSELYINLLTNASTIDFVSTTHPRFVSIIESLTPDEVRILEFASKSLEIPFITVHHIISFSSVGLSAQAQAMLARNYPGGKGVIIAAERATIFEKNELLSLPDKSKFYLANLEGLSLIYIDINTPSSPLAYNLLLEAYDKVINIQEPHTSVSINKGAFRLTEFGQQFIAACKDQSLQDPV